MAKKKKPRRNQGAPKISPLEDLLSIGDAVLYGQICWSIANRGTEPPRVGEVITLEGRNEADGGISRPFRLTRKSIENVERCLGLRTCGEAVDLFAEKREEQPAGQPLAECLHGHQEAALEFLMYGIRPTEPCPQCGDILEFGDAAMSPSFYSDGPVKGVDGREYSVCPKCGEDALELQGNSIVEWGWNIVCLDCGWEVKQAESLDIAKYCDLMDEVKSKVEAIDRLMELPGITIRTRVESICLQLRMVLELIVFSSLVSNKDVWQRSRRELQSSQDISKKLRELKRIHPNFYPSPMDMEATASSGEPSDRTEGFLSEDRLTEVYGRLGNILHAENPLGKETDYRYFINAVPGWLAEVMNLLECHKVYLYHRPEEFHLIKMFGDVDGELMPVRFKTTPEGEMTCAWPDCVSPSARQYCEYIQRPWRECRLREVEPAQTDGKRVAGQLDAPTYEH